MILLFVLLLIGQPTWYFLVELTVFNLLLVLLLRHENAICRQVLGPRSGARIRFLRANRR